MSNLSKSEIVQHTVTYILQLNQSQTMPEAFGCMQGYFLLLGESIEWLSVKGKPVRILFQNKTENRLFFELALPITSLSQQKLSYYLRGASYQKPLLDALTFFKLQIEKMPEYQKIKHYKCPLSVQQLVVLGGLKQGFNTTQILTLAGVSCKQDMLNKNLASMRRILRVKTNAQAIYVALKEGWI